MSELEYKLKMIIYLNFSQEIFYRAIINVVTSMQLLFIFCFINIDYFLSILILKKVNTRQLSKIINNSRQIQSSTRGTSLLGKHICHRNFYINRIARCFSHLHTNICITCINIINNWINQLLCFFFLVTFVNKIKIGY